MMQPNMSTEEEADDEKLQNRQKGPSNVNYISQDSEELSMTR